MKKDVKENVKKQTRKSWVFWIALAVVLRMTTLSAVRGLLSINTEEPKVKTEVETSETVEETTTVIETTVEETTTEAETEELDDYDRLPENIRIMSASMALVFVSAMVEDYNFDSDLIVKYDLDENGDGIIEVLYMPPNAGNGETKVNLTIVKEGNVWTIEKALLAGVYEVDMDTVPEVFKVAYE